MDINNPRAKGGCNVDLNSAGPESFYARLLAYLSAIVTAITTEDYSHGNKAAPRLVTHEAH